MNSSWRFIEILNDFSNLLYDQYFRANKSAVWPFLSKQQWGFFHKWERISFITPNIPVDLVLGIFIIRIICTNANPSHGYIFQIYLKNSMGWQDLTLICTLKIYDIISEYWKFNDYKFQYLIDSLLTKSELSETPQNTSSSTSWQTCHASQ